MEIQASKTRNVFTIAAGAILLAGIFDYLFFDKIIGISVLVFIGLLVTAVYALAVRFKYNYQSSLWLMVPIIFFSIMPGIRANLFLNFLNIVAIIGLLLLATKELLQEHIAKFGLKEYFLTVFLLPLKFILNSIRPVLYAISAFNQSSTGNWRRIVIGVFMALPVLAIFTALFSSADLAFGQFVNSIFSFNVPEEVFGHIFLITMAFIGLLGTFEYIFRASTALPLVPKDESNEKHTTGREVETGVFLFLIAALFLIFIIFQVTYLFGGEVNIANRGFTYAEYARHGFWELLVVASATLVVLFFTDKYTRRETSRKTWFTIPAVVMVLEILVIIISAFKRLILYQDTYGMTLLRFYVAGFIIFLGVIFILLATKFIWEKKENFFTFASLLTMITFLVGVNFINPDAFIAKKNIAQFDQTGKIDAAYLAHLSPDATEQIIAVYDRLSDTDKNIVREIILANQTRWEKSQTNWQSYNYSTSKALSELRNSILGK
jgi:hypothetical protein